MQVKVLGISGSPVKGGNAETLLAKALEAAQGMDNVSVETLQVAQGHISDCRHCNWCLAKQVEGKFCAIDDDMTAIYPKLIEADVLLFSTPAYAARLSGYTATFIDRFRAVLLGKHYKGALRNKVGGAMTVAWFRNAGLETTLLSVVSSLLMWGLVVVTPEEGSCQYGAAALSSDEGSGKFDPKNRLGVLKDEAGIRHAQSLARRSVEMARILKAGTAALKGAP